MTAKALFINAVPLNGGDEATLRAMIESLEARVGGFEPTVLCNNPALTRTWVRDLALGTDLELAGAGSEPGARDAWLSRLVRSRAGRAAADLLPGLAAQLPERRRTLELYGACDIVLASPGGYLYDSYDVDGRFRSLSTALDLGKPVVLLAQSIGPFWKPRSIAQARAVLTRASAIFVRDEPSLTYLAELGVEPSRIERVADAAFLWHRLAPELFVPERESIGRVAVCLREWPLGDTTAREATVRNAVALCTELLREPERRLLFTSTCQGIAGYVDDSTLADEIVARLPGALGARCDVDRQHRGPREIIAQLSECDAFIGMRLHGCILAMLGGTPAMGLGYESKTEEVFGQLGLGGYQVPYDADAAAWLGCAERFFAEQPAVRAMLPDALDRAAESAGRAVDVVAGILARPDERASADACQDKE